MYKRAMLERLLHAACGIYRVKQAFGNGNFTGGRNQVNEAGVTDPTGQGNTIAFNYGRAPAYGDFGFRPNAVQNTYGPRMQQQNANRAAAWKKDPYDMLRRHTGVKLRGGDLNYDAGRNLSTQMGNMRNNPGNRAEQEAMNFVRGQFPRIDADIRNSTEPDEWLDPLSYQ